jgi:hypothetical protein
LLSHPHRHGDQLGNEMINTLARHLGFLTVVLAKRLGLGDGFLQRRNVGVEGLERTKFVQMFVRVFVRASTRRVSGFFGFEIDKDASLAIITPLPRPTPTDGLLARGIRRDVESLSKLAVRQPSFCHRQSPYRCLFACTTARLTNGALGRTQSGGHVSSRQTGH